jgi:hypothetical protein
LPCAPFFGKVVGEFGEVNSSHGLINSMNCDLCRALESITVYSGMPAFGLPEQA